MILIPDLSTIRIASGYKTPTAYVITDAFHADGEEVSYAPRTALKNVLKLYEERGWTPVIAPELEFFLTATNTDLDFPLQTPVGRSGRAETGSEPYGLEAVNEFEDLIEELYEFAEKARPQIDTLIHEAGAGQLEVNFEHGDALERADQILLFKRVIRQTSTMAATPAAAKVGACLPARLSLWFARK